MPEWVRTDIDYGNRMAWVCIPSRTAEVKAGVNLPSIPKPEELEKVCYDLIEELRPEWLGGVIFAIRYRLCFFQWEILLAHRSFPARPDGSDYPSINLIGGEFQPDGSVLNKR
jgi:hypothetical protein